MAYERPPWCAPAHLFLDLYEAPVAALGVRGGDGEVVTFLGHREVLLRRPDRELSGAGCAQCRGLADDLAGGQRTADNGVESVRLCRQRADAELERQTSRGLTVPTPALEIKTVTGLRPQGVLGASRSRSPSRRPMGGLPSQLASMPR